MNWREAMIAAAANARARALIAQSQADNERDPVQKADHLGRAMMANWLADDFVHAASKAPFEASEYVRNMGTPETRASEAEHGKPTTGYGSRRKRT